MIFNGTTDVYGELSAVVSPIFADILPWLILILGLGLGFYIMEKLTDLMAQKYFEKIHNQEKK